MAIVVDGDREVFDQLVFGRPDMNTINYFNQLNQQFAGMLTTDGMSFVQQAQNTFARMDAVVAQDLVNAAHRAINVYGSADVIYQVKSIEDLQEAPNSMVRWIMTHTGLRELYFDNRIDGYSSRQDMYDVYVDPQPGLTGWDMQDYQVVYNGWVESTVEEVTTKDEEGNETVEEVWYDEFVQVLVDDDEPDELTDLDTSFILDAHAMVDVAINEGRDPTSYYDSIIN